MYSKDLGGRGNSQHSNPHQRGPPAGGMQTVELSHWIGNGVQIARHQDGGSDAAGLCGDSRGDFVGCGGIDEQHGDDCGSDVRRGMLLLRAMPMF